MIVYTVKYDNIVPVWKKFPKFLAKIKNPVELLLFLCRSGIIKAYEEKNVCNAFYAFIHRDGSAVRGKNG